MSFFWASSTTSTVTHIYLLICPQIFYKSKIGVCVCVWGGGGGVQVLTIYIALHGVDDIHKYCKQKTKTKNKQTKKKNCHKHTHVAMLIFL